MKSVWTSHLETDEEKEDFKRMVRSAKPVLDRLAHIIQNDLEALCSREESEEDFKSPAWAERQAYRNGYRARSRADLSLLIDQ